ncbi:MAG: stage IV sporulation protein A [Bacillota bacterium]|nr:stage IV sporulation protein A [Bacillota bacterium]
MNSLDHIYEDIATRTGGDIYIGVVGPVRTGKSTFIKRFMDLMVLPNLSEPYLKAQVQDELPQSGSGRTITTTEPKFVPAKAARLDLPGNLHCRVRLVDCVGYMVSSAMGHLENGKPRMVNTPWQEERIPFEAAAELGTRKVIADHSTVGVVVTTDGSVGEIGRENYVPAEERVVQELQALGKPFVVVLNTADPEGTEARRLQAELTEKYQAPVLPVNCARMSLQQAGRILSELLYEFPVVQVDFRLPGFVEGLENSHAIKSSIIRRLRQWAESFRNVRDVRDTVGGLTDGEIVERTELSDVDLGNGRLQVELVFNPELFYQVVGELMGEEVPDDGVFFRLIREFSRAKRAYDKIAGAMEQVEEKGYGIVQPKLAEMTLEEPEIFKQGNKFGVRLKAQAPSLHIIKTRITTEVAPLVGSERQSEDLIQYLMDEFENDPSRIWDTNIFGKPLYEMVTEQMESKLTNVPENIQFKIQRSLQKVSDEGKEYLICVAL